MTSLRASIVVPALNEGEQIRVFLERLEESVDISLSTRHEAGRFAPRGKPNALGTVSFGGLPVEATASKVRDDFFIVCAS